MTSNALFTINPHGTTALAPERKNGAKIVNFWY
jgi:hypothetical protein